MLLPYDDGEVDWSAFEAHVARTVDAGLGVAVNMDTGFVQLLDRETRLEVLDRTAALVGRGGFVGGAFVADVPGARFNEGALHAAVGEVADRGGTPIVVPHFGLAALGEAEAIAAHARLTDACSSFYAFELSPAFSPAGRIFSLDAWTGLLDIHACRGTKHSSLRRADEWERLARRDERRPGFHVFTGNDLAIDMVMYGSDYLLWLSTFAPDLFAERDRLWADGDAAFHELNDGLQALGAFTFRDPVPAYKHAAAQFLHLRGWVGPDACHPKADRRPESDVLVLRSLGARLGIDIRG